MGPADYDNKLNSKTYLFFDKLFKIVASNIIISILSLTIVGIYPSVVAAIATFKEDTHQGGFFKSYFRNLLKYLKKSIIVGVLSTIIIGVAGFAIYFYSEARLLMMNRVLVSEIFNKIFNVSINIDNAINPTLDFMLTAGFVVNIILIILTVLLLGNMAFIFINFPVLNIRESIRTSLYISIRYFFTSFICFIINLVIVLLFVSCLFDARLLAVFLLIGISLPLFLETHITTVIYEKIKSLNIERIMHDYGEEYE